MGRGQCGGREGGAGSVWGQCGGGKGRRDSRQSTAWHVHIALAPGRSSTHPCVCDDTSAQLDPHPPFHTSFPLSLYPHPILISLPSLPLLFASSPPPVPPLCSCSSPTPPVPPLYLRPSPYLCPPLSSLLRVPSPPPLPPPLPGLPIRSVLPCPELLVDVYVGGDRVHTDGMQGAIFLHSAHTHTHHTDVVTLPTLPHTLA